MELRRAGKTGLNISRIGLGTMTWGRDTDESEAAEQCRIYIEAGRNFIDTADMYSHWVPGNKGGESETILGNWMKARNNRNQIVLATKVAK